MRTLQPLRAFLGLTCAVRQPLWGDALTLRGPLCQGLGRLVEVRTWRIFLVKDRASPEPDFPAQSLAQPSRHPRLSRVITIYKWSGSSPLVLEGQVAGDGGSGSEPGLWTQTAWGDSSIDAPSGCVAPGQVT